MSETILRAIGIQVGKEIRPLWEKEVLPHLADLKEFIRAEIKTAVAEAVRDLHNEGKI